MAPADALVLDATDLKDRLQQTIALQRAATPEPECCEDIDDARIAYSYICECHRTRFGEEGTDEIRARIADSSYWFRELGHYKKEVDHKMESLLATSQNDNSSANGTLYSIERLRNLIGGYQRLLEQLGCTPQDVKELRYTIRDQRYWKPESFLLAESAALLESTMIEDYHKAKASRMGSDAIASMGEQPQSTRERPTKREVKHKSTSGVKKYPAKRKTGPENFARSSGRQILGYKSRRARTGLIGRDSSKLLQ